MRLDLVQLQCEIICVNKWFLFVSIFSSSSSSSPSPPLPLLLHTFFCTYNLFLLNFFFFSLSRWLLLVLVMAIDVSLLALLLCFSLSLSLSPLQRFSLFYFMICVFIIYLRGIACDSVFKFKSPSSAAKKQPAILHMYTNNYDELKAERKTNYKKYTITEKNKIISIMMNWI